MKWSKSGVVCRRLEGEPSGAMNRWEADDGR